MSRYRFHSHMYYRYIVAGLLLISLYTIYSNCVIKMELPHITHAKVCYLHNGRNPNGTGKFISFFDDILTATQQPENDQGIFFVETNCSGTAIADFNQQRYACSVETAARLNPGRPIFMVYASPVGLPMHEVDWPPAIKTLLKYPNIHFRNVQLKQLCAGTPLEEWIETSDLFKSIAPCEHVSDLIRDLLLYKYGGTYLDQDYMLNKNLNTIKKDFITLEPTNTFSNAILDFRHTGIGHIVLHETLSEIAIDFRYNEWGHNGGMAFERVMRRVCNENDLKKVTNNRDQCRGFEIHPSKYFSPTYVNDSHKYFKPNETKEVMQRLKNVIGFHLFSSWTKKVPFTKGQGAAYDLIAQQNCPHIYAANKDF